MCGKRDSVSQKLLYKQLSEGVANMVDMEIFFAAIKASWIKIILLTPLANWSILGNNHLHKIAQSDIITNMNFEKQEMLSMLRIIPTFYQKIVTSYAKCNKTKLVM